MASLKRDSAKPILWIVICGSICMYIWKIACRYGAPIDSIFDTFDEFAGSAIAWGKTRPFYWLGFWYIAFWEDCMDVILYWLGFWAAFALGLACCQVRMGKKVIVRPKVDWARAWFNGWDLPTGWWSLSIIIILLYFYQGKLEVPGKV